VFLSGQFAFSQASDEQVTLTDHVTTKDVNVLKIGASGVDAFVGVGGPYFDTNGGVHPDGAMGFVLHDLEFGLALLKPTSAADTTSYYAFKASGSVAIVGITGITLRADHLGVEVNGASSGRAIDFSVAPLTIPTGPEEGGVTPNVVLDSASGVMRAFGDVTLVIDNFVYVSGSFSFSSLTDPVSVHLAGAPSTTKMVNILTVGAENVHAFVGIGDPDSNGDGVFNASDNPAAHGAIGVVIHDLDFGLALLKPVDSTDHTSYYALVASAGQISLVGVPSVLDRSTEVLQQKVDKGMPALRLAVERSMRDAGLEVPR